MDHNFKPKETPSDFGWHSRGYIPHFDAGEVCHFVTLRLHDSMPQKVLEKWKKSSASDAEFRRKVESYLDSGYGECWLKNERIATLVQDSLRYHDAKKYKLIS